ncbi:hypothetical protein FSP39_000980, partial [Pinctada imbricata]
LCCQCGTQIEPNPSNMCVSCIRTQVDITEGIPKQAVLYFCRNCERYLQPPNHWIPAALESRELLSVCLKKMKGLNKVRLVDAGFIWTEPHSMRIKVKLTVQKEVMNNAVLEQVFVVEFTVNNQMCDDCHRVEAKDFWRAVVQIRQKTDHKKTFYYLEQLILKHKAHANTVNIKIVHDGIDFYYAQKQDARKMVDFLLQVVPCKYQTAQELVTHDPRNNVYTYKHTFSVEIIPVCKDNIVCLPPKLAMSLGNISPLCVCHRVTQSVHLIDPCTLQVAELNGTSYWRHPFQAVLAEMNGTSYWRHPFQAVCSPKHLSEFMVIDIEVIPDRERPHRTPVSTKHVLANVWLAKLTNTGLSEQQFFTKTHIGHLLNAGDTVLGFDFVNANLNNAQLEKMKPEAIPDVVIVKKVFGDKAKRNKRRRWKLRHLHDDLHLETSSNERDYTDFLEDLEEDNVYREHVNIYKDAAKIAVDQNDTDDEGLPQISLQEMLDDLHLEEDATGADGADMLE